MIARFGVSAGCSGGTGPNPVPELSADWRNTDKGAWIGTADSLAIELVDWTGTTIDRIRWDGLDLEVTDDHLDAYRDDLCEAYRNQGREDWGATVQQLLGD